MIRSFLRQQPRSRPTARRTPLTVELLERRELLAVGPLGLLSFIPDFASVPVFASGAPVNDRPVHVAFIDPSGGGTTTGAVPSQFPSNSGSGTAVQPTTTSDPGGATSGGSVSAPSTPSSSSTGGTNSSTSTTGTSGTGTGGTLGNGSGVAPVTGTSTNPSTSTAAGPGTSSTSGAASPTFSLAPTLTPGSNGGAGGVTSQLPAPPVNTATPVPTSGSVPASRSITDSETANGAQEPAVIPSALLTDIPSGVRGTPFIYPYSLTPFIRVSSFTEVPVLQAPPPQPPVPEPDEDYFVVGTEQGLAEMYAAPINPTANAPATGGPSATPPAVMPVSPAPPAPDYPVSPAPNVTPAPVGPGRAALAPRDALLDYFAALGQQTTEEPVQAPVVLTAHATPTAAGPSLGWSALALTLGFGAFQGTVLPDQSGQRQIPVKPRKKVK